MRPGPTTWRVEDRPGAQRHAQRAERAAVLRRHDLAARHVRPAPGHCAASTAWSAGRLRPTASTRWRPRSPTSSSTATPRPTSTSSTKAAPLFEDFINVQGRGGKAEFAKTIVRPQGRHDRRGGGHRRRKTLRRYDRLGHDPQVGRRPDPRRDGGLLDQGQSQRRVDLRLLGPRREARSGDVRQVPGGRGGKRAEHRPDRQSRLEPVGGHAVRSASVPAAPARSGRDPHAADRQRRQAARCGCPSTASAARWTWRGWLGTTSNWARRDCEDAGPVPPLPRRLPGRLGAMEDGRGVRQSRRLLPPVPGLDGRDSPAGDQRHPSQSERHRLQPHRHSGPRADRRRTDHDLPRIEARHDRRHVRGICPAPLVPVRRAGPGLPRRQGAARGGPGQRRPAAAGRVSRAVPSVRPAERLRAGPRRSRCASPM